MSLHCCDRCGRVTTALAATPLLRLCARCPLVPVDDGHAHTWRGTREERWVCTDCGKSLLSQDISTEPVTAPQPIDADLW